MPENESDRLLGPIIDQRQLAQIDDIVQASIAQGASLKAGGTYQGPFYAPTVLADVKPGMRAFDEEIFGPVASVVTFESDEEAVSLANRTEYGLAAGIISRSMGRALHLGNQLRVGMLHINDQTVGDQICNPFGGCGASGNGGRHGGPSNWEEFSQWQWVTMKDKASSYPF